MFRESSLFYKKINNKYSTGWQIVPAVAIEEVKDKDIFLLYKIQEYFGVGRVQIIKK